MVKSPAPNRDSPTTSMIRHMHLAATSRPSCQVLPPDSTPGIIQVTFVSGYQMDMNMENRLSGCPATVDSDVVSVGTSFLVKPALAVIHNLKHRVPFPGRCVEETCHMPFGNNEHVSWGNRIFIGSRAENGVKKAGLRSSNPKRPHAPITSDPSTAQTTQTTGCGFRQPAMRRATYLRRVRHSTRQDQSG